MVLELRHLRYLLAVAEHGSFTRAAEELRVSQPTLSQQVKQLERSMGVQLLDRTGRSVRLTDAGAAYVPYARRALRDLAAAERAVLDVADLSRGALRLAMTPTFTAYLLGPLAAGLHALHPGITLDVKEMAQGQLESALLADEVDLGIALRGAHLPGVSATDLFTETLSLVVGSGHPYLAHPSVGHPHTGHPEAGRPQAGRLQPLPVRELAACPLALLSGDFATRGHIDAYLARHAVEPPIAVQASSISALTEIVRRTGLATVLPDALTRDDDRLHPVPLEPALPTRTVALLRRESAYESAASRAFSSLARRWADPAAEAGLPGPASTPFGVRPAPSRPAPAWAPCPCGARARGWPVWLTHSFRGPST